MCFSEVSDKLDAPSYGVTVFGSGRTWVFERRKTNSFILKTETIGFSENSRQVHYTARCKNSENRHLSNTRSDKLVSFIINEAGSLTLRS